MRWSLLTVVLFGCYGAVHGFIGNYRTAFAFIAALCLIGDNERTKMLVEALKETNNFLLEKLTKKS